MKYKVLISDNAKNQLLELFGFIKNRASNKIASNYIKSIIEYLRSFSSFPHRGEKRDDLRKGLRVTHYKGRIVIAFFFEYDRVFIIGIYYGGQNIDTLLSF